MMKEDVENNAKAKHKSQEDKRFYNKPSCHVKHLVKVRQGKIYFCAFSSKLN